MPFPATQEALFTAGYSYLKWDRCPVCTLDVEVWNTPGKRTIAMEPMPGISSPAVRHYEQCNIAPKQEEINGRGNLQDVAGRDSNDITAGSLRMRSDGFLGTNRRHEGGHKQTGIPMGGRDAQGSGIKLYGVTDKNMIAAGWLGGTLAIQFRYGKYHYANVAEDVFQKIRNNPFPNSLFVKLVKNHPELYPCTKVG
jgi:hypothetical protein